MQRVPKLIGANALTTQVLNIEQSLIPNAIYTQCVRWKRKPIWLPTAKSKLFRVPKRVETPPLEAAEIARLYNNYRTFIKSTRYYIINAAQKSKVKKDTAFLDELVKADFEECNNLNNVWNAQVAAEREKRMLEEREKRIDVAKRRLQKKEFRDQRLREQVDEKIRIMKKESVKFITPENIDEAIENALNGEIIDHNAAVDIDGKFIKSSSSIVSELANQTKPTFNQETLRFENAPTRRARQ